jgi:hypothetical protein
MHRKSHINCPGIQHDPSRWQAWNMTLSGLVFVIGLSSTLTALPTDLTWNPNEHFPRCIHYAANAYIQLLSSVLDPVIKVLNDGRLCFVEPVQAVVKYTEINAWDYEQGWIPDTFQFYFHSVTVWRKEMAYLIFFLTLSTIFLFSYTKLSTGEIILSRLLID